MKNLQMLEALNGLFCITSFIIYFVCICLDLADTVHGNFFRRLVYFFCLLVNASLIIRISSRDMDNLFILWLVVSVIMGVAKYLQFKGKTQQIDDKISRTINNITQRPTQTQVK